MNMLIDELALLAANPWAWGVVALLAVLAVHAVVVLLFCPYAGGTAKISDDEVDEASSSSFRPGARFALTMIAGAGMTIVGLFLIANGINPALALGALVAGIVIIQTEPGRLSIREMMYAVVANRDAPAEVIDGHRDRLRSGQRALAMTNVGILLAVVVALLAF